MSIHGLHYTHEILKSCIFRRPPGKPKLQSSCVFPNSILTLSLAKLFMTQVFFLALYTAEASVPHILLITWFGWCWHQCHHIDVGLTPCWRSSNWPQRWSQALVLLDVILDPQSWFWSLIVDLCWSRSCGPVGLTAMQQGGRLDPWRFEVLLPAEAAIDSPTNQPTCHQVVQHSSPEDCPAVFSYS